MADDTRVTWVVPGKESPVGAPSLELPPRYSAPEPLGHGGMGEVWAVWDGTLERQVALKVLAPALWEVSVARRRYLAEARTMALLDHPDIVAIHDRGDLSDGAPYYTMRLVRGRTLAQQDGASLRAMLGWWVRIAEAVAYAHSRGVVHRDLKPENVMIGPFGEVQLVDWGIAHHLTGADPVVHGGSPNYMPPEQRAGDTPAASADCFALGRLLHEVVGSSHELAGLVSSALGTVASRPSAAALAEGVRNWLDGAQRRERALDCVVEADRWRVQATESARTADQLSRAAAEALARLPRFAPSSDKVEAWDLEDQSRSARVDAALSDARCQLKLGAALNLEPDLEEAHVRLAVKHRDQLVKAEAAADPEAIARHTELVRAHGRKADVEWLFSGGHVDLHTMPTGATVIAERLEEVGRRLVPVSTTALGETPLHRAALGRGRWVLRIAHPDCHSAVYPVRIRRGTHWNGVPAGADEVHAIRLIARGDLADGDCYVPAGWFQSGGDDSAVEALTARRLWVDGFVVKRHPVTNAEYLGFLDALVADGRAEEAVERAGRTPGGDALHVLKGTSFQSVRAGGLPVVSITGHDAVAYAEWMGNGWRLPHDQEWEKAARGVDGRALPWGFENEPSWTRRADSCSPPTLAEVHELGRDVSPYGVEGLAGNVADWCGNPFDKQGPPDGSRVVLAPPAPGFWAVRGGHFAGGAAAARAATRFAADSERRLTATGIRLVRSLREPWP